MQKVVVIGAGVIDALLKSKNLKVVKGHEVPGGIAMCEVVGGKMEADDGIMDVGGGGTNVAVGLHRLGEAVKVITRIGSDNLADVIVGELKKEDIDLSLIQKGQKKTGLSAVLIAENGSRTIITYRGESAVIDQDKIDWKTLEKADWIQISSLGGEMQLLEDLVSFAINNGIRIGCNPGKKEITQKERLLKLLPKFDFFNVNRSEARDLVGGNFEDEKAIIKKLADLGSRILAVTDGKRGASLVVNRRWVKMDAYKTESIDDTGAGDGFVSGAVAGILQDKKPEDILKMGLANGASVVTKLGAKGGLLHKNEIDKWMKKKVKSVEEWI